MKKVLCSVIVIVMVICILSGCTPTTKKVLLPPLEEPLSEPTLDISDISVMLQGKETDGLYHKFQLTYGSQVKQFKGNHLAWWDTPRIYMIDVNDDQAKEIVVVLTAGHGTGCLIEELHIFDAITLHEYNCTNIFDIINDSLNFYNDAENYYIQSPSNLFTVSKSIFYAEQNQLFDSIGIGEFITFSVDSDNLFCTLGCQVVANSFCGYLNIGLELDHDNIRCLTYDYISGV